MTLITSLFISFSSKCIIIFLGAITIKELINKSSLLIPSSSISATISLKKSLSIRLSLSSNSLYSLSLKTKFIKSYFGSCTSTKYCSILINSLYSFSAVNSSIPLSIAKFIKRSSSLSLNWIKPSTQIKGVSII